jgi:hypothetical protein
VGRFGTVPDADAAQVPTQSPDRVPELAGGAADEGTTTPITSADTAPATNATLRR